MAERKLPGLERVLGVNALFATAYGNVGSSVYYALGLVASYALGLTPIVFIITGIFFVLSPSTLVDNVHFGVAPTWSNLLIALPIGMLAYTGIETVSNMS